MNHTLKNLLIAVPLALLLASAPATGPAPEKSWAAPNGQTLSVKMIGPVTQETDLQILCLLKHSADGDAYIEAVDDFNKKVGGLLSSIRDNGAFVGEMGETFLFTPPPNTIAPKRVLLIGVGDEKNLKLDTLKLAGRIAARESTRLGVSHVSFAPTLRDQGSSRVDVAAGDATFVAGWILAYDTECRLQQEHLAPVATVATLTIEAGPKYFDSVVAEVEKAVATTGDALKTKVPQPFVRP
jgi:hypothetical protein